MAGGSRRRPRLTNGGRSHPVLIDVIPDPAGGIEAFCASSRNSPIPICAILNRADGRHVAQWGPESGGSKAENCTKRPDHWVYLYLNALLLHRGYAAGEIRRIIAPALWQNPAAWAELQTLNQDFIEETVVGFANAGYDQAYGTLAAVARFWSKEHPDRLDRVMRAIPKPSPDRLTDDESRANFGDI